MLVLTLRRIEGDHQFHVQLHDFSKAIEHALTGVLLVALGVMLPLLLPGLNWRLVVLAITFLFIVRPVVGWVALLGTELPATDRAPIAVYCVRGVGSIYYLCYAGTHMEFANEAQLWSLIGLVILLSTILHGFTVGMAMDRLSGERDASRRRRDKA